MSRTKKNNTASRSTKELTGVSLLGSKNTEYKMSYTPEVLETFVNKNPENPQWVTFLCSEFTSLCPKTNQPDFARIYINYIPSKLMVESKSLKLYLFSFRNHGDFHEDCVQKICNDLVKLMEPLFIEVIGEFTPRGGIAIYPYSSFATNKEQFKKLKEQRFIQYSPGKYTMDLGRIY